MPAINGEKDQKSCHCKSNRDLADEPCGSKAFEASDDTGRDYVEDPSTCCSNDPMAGAHSAVADGCEGQVQIYETHAFEGMGVLVQILRQ